MRNLISLTVLALVAGAAAPAMAGDVSGFYAGIYGGGVVKSSAESALGGHARMIETDSSHATPTGFIQSELPASDADIARLQPIVLATPNIRTLFDFDFFLNGTMSNGRSGTFGGVMGYGFGNGVRLELDYGRSALNADTISVTSSGITIAGGIIDDDTGVWEWASMTGSYAGPVESLSLGSLDYVLFGGVSARTTADFLLVNGWYDFDTGTKLTPYVGGGVGLAHLSTSFDTCECDLSIVATTQTGFVPAAQVGAGLKIRLSDPLSLDFGYRLKVAGAPGGSASLSAAIDDLSAAISTDLTQTGIYTQHTITAGLTYAFN